MRELDRLLSVQKQDFKSWQDADVYAVTNIFSFYDQSGNQPLTDIVATLLNHKEVVSNELLSGINFNTSNELDLLESIIDAYIQSGLMLQDPKFLIDDFSNSINIDKCIQAHQIMLYLISVCSIRLHKELQLNDSFKSFINVMMNKDIVSRIVAKKQADYGPGNITKFGIYGLIVRTHDKIGRLRNLIHSSSINSVKDETVYDTLIDLVGYCTVSYLWINNWFLIPMDRGYSFDT